MPQKDPEKHRQYSLNYYYLHREEILKKERENEERKEYQKNYRYKIRNQNEWRKSNPDLHRKYRKTQKAKRRRLGFIPFNERFSGADAHHINRKCIVYVPHELHISIRHNIWTGRGMKEINDKVFEWLEQRHEELTQPLLVSI